MTIFERINPATEEALEPISGHSPGEVEEKIAKAVRAFEKWRRLSFSERGRLFQSLGILLKRNSDQFAQLISQEMGKTLPEAKAEIEKCASGCQYYATEAESLLEARPVRAEFLKSYVAFEPMGPLLGILPWNFPLWQFFRFAVPNLMAGNVILFKHAPNTIGSAVLIEELFEHAGFDKGVVSLLKLEVDAVPALIQDSRIRGVSLTGSTRAGRSVAALAGQALKPCVLELGGSDAYVILDDANLDRAVERAVTARFLNCGQSCVSAKRMIVSKKREAEVLDRVRARIQGLTFGAPTEKVNMGPLARRDLRDQLHAQVESARAEGLQVLMGGQVPVRRGFFYPPTLLVGAHPQSVAFREELFGPVATLAVAQDEAQALLWANATSYGLGAAIFSEDRERAESLARTHLEAGMCFVNDFVRSTISLPFGGLKDSGFGRELGTEGIRAFTNAKAICVN